MVSLGMVQDSILRVERYPWSRYRIPLLRFVLLIHKFLLSFFTFFSTGNVDKARQSEAGEMDFLWREQFGGIVRLKGPFGVRLRRLILPDPVF